MTNLRATLLAAILLTSSGVALVASQAAQSSLFYERQTQVTSLSGQPAISASSATATLSAIAQAQASSHTSDSSTSSATTASVGSTRSGTTMSDAERKKINEYDLKETAQEAYTKAWLSPLGKEQRRVAAAIYDTLTDLSKELAHIIAKYMYEFQCICDLTIEADQGVGIFALIALPDGRLVSIDTNDSIKIWNTSNGTCEHSLIRNQGGFRLYDRTHRFVALPDSRFVSGGSDGSIKIWNTTNGTCEHTLMGHRSNIYCLVVLPEDRIASGSGNGDDLIKIWNTSNGTCERTLTGSKYGIRCLIVLPHGRIASGDYCSIKIWNTSNGTCERTLRHGFGAYCLVVLPNDRIASGYAFGSIKIWNTANGTCERTLTTGQKAPVSHLVALSNSRIASTDKNGLIEIWNTTNGSCEDTLSGYEHGCETKPAVLPNGRIASPGISSSIRIWNTTEGICYHIPAIGREPASSFVVLSDGRLASGSLESNLIDIWS